MNFKRWFLTGILVILTMSFAAATGIMVVLRDREVTQRQITEKALVLAREANERLKDELVIYKEKSIRIEKEFSALEKSNQLTLVRLKGLEKKFNRLQEEVSREREEKQTLAEERQELNNQLRMVTSEKNSLRTRLNRLMARSPKEVDLGQIVVSAAPPLEGKILVVNRKFQFVVVDLGQETDLDIGALLNVYRENEFIGRVQVDHIRETVAACKILPEWTLQDIQEDDYVKEL